jgi:nucleoside-diphosphate-sugar epimerase
MNICVIGGSGFVGSRLIPELLLMGKVSVFDKQTSPFFPELTQIIDIRDKVQLEINLKGFDLVIHLAAEHKDDVYPASLYYDVNVTGTKNILDAMVLNSIHQIIFFSSVAVFGLNKPNPDENYPKDPFNHYGKSKLQAENVIIEWLKTDRQGNAVIIRPTVIFGERNRGNVYTLLKQISSGKFMQIGKGDNKKSMAYVGNIVDFVRFIIGKVNKDCLIYNYIDKPDITINELIKVVKNTMNIQIPQFKIPYFLGYTAGKIFDFVAFITGRKLSISSVRIKKFCAATQFDSSKMLVSGFVPPYKLIEGLERTMNFEFMQKRDDEVIFISE